MTSSISSRLSDFIEDPIGVIESLSWVRALLFLLYQKPPLLLTVTCADSDPPVMANVKLYGPL